MSRPKAPVQGLVFYPKSHRYKLDGFWVPGVTTLIGKGLPKVLHYWSARRVAEYVADNRSAVEQLYDMGRGPMVAALKEVPWQERDEAAVRGTDVHVLAEKLVHGEEVDVPDYILGHVEGYARFLDAFAVEPILTEHAVGSRKWQYAGTFDLAARIGGVTWGLDNKSSRDVYGETALQLAAYFGAEFYLAEDGTEQPLPEVERMGVLHIRADGTDLYPIKDPGSAWKDFLHVAWTAKATDRIKAQVADPLPYPTEETAA